MLELYMNLKKTDFKVKLVLLVFDAVNTIAIDVRPDGCWRSCWRAAATAYNCKILTSKIRKNERMKIPNIRRGVGTIGNVYSQNEWIFYEYNQLGTNRNTRDKDNIVKR